MTVTTMQLDDWSFCSAMLPKVSRTFAVCIRLLPNELEQSVLVAYLLCRVADTLEDSTRILADQRADLLEQFGGSLSMHEGSADGLGAIFAQPQTDEEALVHEVARVMRVYRALPAAHRDAIQPWVREMCFGMASFVRREAAANLASLTTVDDLDRYCYYVAGTVGHLLTALFRVHYGLGGGARLSRLQELAGSFGLGLQLTNIIKDVSEDRLRGWNFVPRQICEFVGIKPEDIHDRAHAAESRRALQILIDKAKRHLQDALDYSTTLPRRDSGIRQFCLTSLYFAVQTLRRAEQDERLLDPDHKVKISRSDVVRTVQVTRVVAPSNVLVRLYFWVLAGRAWHRRTDPLLTNA